MKGFAFMLGLGVIVSLFTAVLATQAILFSLRGTRLIRGRFGLGASEQRFNLRKNYMGASKWFFSASGLIMLIGAFAIAGNGFNFGIDFEGGTRITAALQKDASVEQVRNAVAGLRPGRRRGPDDRQPGPGPQRRPDLLGLGPGPHRGGAEGGASRSSGSTASRRRSRSARPSARAWRGRR